MDDFPLWTDYMNSAGFPVPDDPELISLVPPGRGFSCSPALGGSGLEFKDGGWFLKPAIIRHGDGLICRERKGLGEKREGGKGREKRGGRSSPAWEMESQRIRFYGIQEDEGEKKKRQ